MSYDLMVFDPAGAPGAAAVFESWFQSKMEEIDECLVLDPAAMTPSLRGWYADMTIDFPDHNASTDVDGLGDAATGYSACPTAIYADFRWPKSESAFRRVTELAAKHRLGFYDVSGSKGQVWGPRGDQYVLLFELAP
jgi:hypothetical protein